jgi:hypothetical protein
MILVLLMFGGLDISPKQRGRAVYLHSVLAYLQTRFAPVLRGTAFFNSVSSKERPELWRSLYRIAKRSRY